MAVGYTPEWWPLLTAIEHVQRVAGTTIDVATEALMVPLREGKIKTRYRGQPLGGIAGHYEGWGGEIAPEQWYRVTGLYPNGDVEFAPNYPELRRIRQRHQIEVRRADVLKWWPDPPEPPGTGEKVAAGASEPQATNAAEASEACATAADSDGRSRKTVGYPDLKAAIQKYGQAPECYVIAHTKAIFPGKHVPRGWVRRALVELWGKPKLGRPKSPQ
jgi:hypothetical protein